MSLSIDVSKVTDVLLADAWHKVLGTSFTVSVYDFVQQGPDGEVQTIFAGAVSDGHVARGGAAWQEQSGNKTTWTGCPLTSVLAVRYTTAAMAADAGGG
jgi:hypothetical protein